MITVEGSVELAGTRRQVFGLDLPQVPSVGETIEHPEGIGWRVLDVRWVVRGADHDAEHDVVARLVVEPE